MSVFAETCKHYCSPFSECVLSTNIRGGSMRATILPMTIVLTKAHRAAVSIMAKGCIVA